MNHVYRVVFNRSLGVYQCVSELAKSRGKSSGKSQVSTKLILAPLAVAMLGLSSTTMAVTYDNGQTTTITDDPYLVTGDLIIGSETKVDFLDVIIGQSNEGQLKVTNDALANGSLSIAPEVTSNKVILGADKGFNGTLALNLSTRNSTAVKMNVKDDLIVGESGIGHLYVQDGSRLSIQGDLISGQLSNSLNNTIDINSSYYSETNIDVKGKTVIGDAGTSMLTVNNGGISSEQSFIIGNQIGSKGEVLVEGKAGVSAAYASAGTGMDIGLEGTGSLDIKENGFVYVYGGLTVGGASTGVGTINIEGDTGEGLDAEQLIIGKNGKGFVNAINGYDPIDTSWSRALDIDGDVTIGDDIKGVGQLNVDSTWADMEDLVVGNKGSGTLKVVNKGLLDATNISRGIDSVLSDIYFDNAIINITESQSKLFANFTDKQPINIGSNGLVLDVFDNNVDINSNAVLTGNVGAVDFKGAKGGFAKIGTGTLTMSANSKQWTGETLIAEGILKLNGDYIMAANETLGIALDIEEEGNLESYGQLVVNGNADISKGALKVYASEAIAGMSGSNEWKNIVSADSRTGEFVSVSDNSPLVSFYADYSDANAVHLKMGTAPVEPEPPVVTPEPPVVTPQPPVVTPEPPVVTPEPPVVTPEPPVVTPQPPVVTPEPPVVTPEQPVVTPEQPVVTPEQPVVTPEQPVVTPEPPVVTPEPPVVTPEPPVVDTTFVESVNTQSQRNDVGIAYVLDKAIQDRVTNGDNVLADSLINSTTNFNQSQLAAVANQLQPLFMGATNRIITDANYAASDAINEHTPITSERNIWAKLIGSEGNHDAENGITGYDTEGYGAIVGLDTPINTDLNLGLAVSYIQSDADTDGSRLDHELTAKNWQILGYGNYAAGEATQVNFHAGAGRSDVKGERHLSIVTDAIANSDYSVDTLQAGLGVGHRIGNEQRHLTPFAQVNYAQAKSDGYRETGAGVYNLDVSENTYESMRWTAGLRMSQLLTSKLSLTGQLAAAIENGDQQSDITASFVGMPNDQFTTIGQEVGREIGIASIGLSYTPMANMKISAGYRGEWRDNYDDHGASIALQTTF